MPPDPYLLALIQWHPRFSGVWCGVILLGAAAWLYFLQRRMLRRVSPRQARWLLLPKILTLLALSFLLFDPVSAVQKNEATQGKVLALVDDSASMDVADDYRQSRVARARNLVASWKGALPRGVSLDELEFDTILHPAGAKTAAAARGTDLGGCLLAVAERNDLAAYLGVVLLTDGGDEALDQPVLPKLPLYVVGLGTDPATWNDVALAGADGPATAEKDMNFDISADLQARAGRGGDFAAELSGVRLRLEHAVGSNTWEKLSAQSVDLSNLHRVVHLSVKCGEVGTQRYRVSVEPLPGELSPLNNFREVTVEVQKKSLHVLFFTEELGQEFKVLRNELAHDPGIAFTALFRTTASRFMLQGDRQAGDEVLDNGLPETGAALAPYDVIVLGSFPATDLTARQIQALVDFCAHGGIVAFLGGDASYGRGGYANTPLAALFPWRISNLEPEPGHGLFPVQVPPMGADHPLLAGVEDILARNSVTLDALNQVDELKPGAQALLITRVGSRERPVAAVQPYGRGKVLAIATSTLWKWAAQPEPVRPAYGLFWRQAVRVLAGKTDGAQNVAVRWDRDFYRPGELASAEVHTLGASAAALQFNAAVTVGRQSVPVPVEPAAGQPGTFTVKYRFRERGNYNFRLVAYQGGRVADTYEKEFAVAPLLPEGSRLELDAAALKKLAAAGGGVYFSEGDAGGLPEQLAGKSTRQVTVEESSLAEAGPWYLLIFLGVLVGEWIMRRKLNLF